MLIYQSRKITRHLDQIKVVHQLAEETALEIRLILISHFKAKMKKK